ncbi:MAG TPA: RNA polymerase sigma factor [Acidimicrobiales bacterium]|nr:RNA polymerase sigma factor [Acidimicrobiales bacterium]
MDALTRLAVAARDGDPAALDAFLDAAYVPVHRLCRALAGPTDGPDLAQEAVVRVVRALPGYGGDAPATAWVLRIARNVCIDAHRSRARRARLAGQLASERGRRVPASATGPEGAVVLAGLLAHLDTDRRDALVLTRWVGLSYAEAADVLGVPVGTVRSRVARGRAELAALLADDDADRTPGAGAPRGVAPAVDEAG